MIKIFTVNFLLSYKPNMSIFYNFKEINHCVEYVSNSLKIRLYESDTVINTKKLKFFIITTSSMYSLSESGRIYKTNIPSNIIVDKNIKCYDLSLHFNVYYEISSKKIIGVNTNGFVIESNKIIKELKLPNFTLYESDDGVIYKVSNIHKVNKI